MSRPIVNTSGPGMVAATARTFSIISAVIALAVLLIFVTINGGLKDKAQAGMSTTSSAPASP